MSDYVVDLNKLEAAFSFEEGFSRPNWHLIGRHVEQTVEREDLNQAWAQLAWQWAGELGSLPPRLLPTYRHVQRERNRDGTNNHARTDSLFLGTPTDSPLAE